jgi:ubiquinone/menaquinone biosynthesis C-methylase UbiE
VKTVANHFERRVGKDCEQEQWHFEHLWPYLQNLSGKKILDVGCGRGLLCSRLSEKNDCVGFDMLSENPRNINLVVTDCAKEFPAKDNEFDLVICSHYIEHSSNPELTLNEIKRVLKVGGKAFILVPNEYTWRNKLDFLLGKQLPSHQVDKWGHKCLPTLEEWKYFIKKTFEKSTVELIPDTHGKGLVWKLSRLFGSKIDNTEAFLFICSK